MLTRAEFVSRVIGRIDRAKLAEIERRFVAHGYGKYFDVEHWVGVNVDRALRIGLHKGKRRRVLDLGAGFGYFLLVCRELGHDVQGVDIEEPIYQAVTSALDVPVLIAPIEAERPLPVPPPYDVVTAHMICFNGHNTRSLWGLVQWRALLEQLAGATVHLELNTERSGLVFPRGVVELFLEHGAMITGNHVLFMPVEKLDL